MIECHTRIERIIDQRIAYCLHVSTECSHMVECKDFAIHRVGLDVIGDNLKGIGMHKERIALRVINSHSTIGTKSKASILVILSVVTSKFVLVHRVNIHYITESLTETFFAIVVHAVAHHRLALI